MEELELPCGVGKVDIIISEWMGYILLRESMLDSVIRARNKWLNPQTGVLFPSHATMYWGAISFEDDRLPKMTDYYHSMEDWQTFSRNMQQNYNINVKCLTAAYDKEQADYFIYSALWTELQPEHVLGQPVVIKQIDLNTCTLEDVDSLRNIPFSFKLPVPAEMSGFAGWFTTDFAGSVNNPVTKRVILSTGPEVGYTHWGQQVFYLPDAIPCVPGTEINGVLSMVRQEKNARLYNMHISYTVNNDENHRKEHIYEIP